ncbi:MULTISPECIES: flagellar hook-length control protein FliK [Marinobacter]|uniref:Flagellar hook-length control protein FliK n=1 Tax=Marinobacter alkaliphilus TaxID=254719 RepID=A0ABZ3E6D8_9GAMM|nr:flagellar hook-length control protein FliK [Marinobacter shengliensis]
MQQMILPQAPAPGAQKDTATNKPAGNRDSGSESRFDEVSRAERKRLDQKQADRQDHNRAVQDKREARRADKKDANAPKESAASESADKPGSPVTEAKEPGSQRTAAKQEEPSQIDSVPMTFASLQSLLVPAGNPLPATDADPLMNPALMPMTGMQGAINGQNGQQGPATATMNLSTQLTDLLSAGVAGESTRPVDPANLLSAPRFQAALEVASQQAAQPARLAAEAAVPLKGYATSVEVPVGQAEWGDKVMGKLSWLTARNMSVAEIHLTPPDMGPMEVKVRVQNDQANITVHAANPVVREQLELNSHRLRDMLGDQGLSLSQFDVSDQPGRQGGEQGEGSGEHASAGESGGPLAGDTDESLQEMAGLDLGWKGEVDVFA